jgi:type I restriction enzyme S subunit
MKKGWQTKRLGDVCEIIKGRKPALNATSSNGDLPYLVAKVMRGSKEAEYASVKDRNSITVEESETIIICDGSNSGEVFTGFRGILSSTMGKIAKKAEIDDDYLRAFLASTFDVFNGAKTGAAIPHLDKEAMYQLQFPFPPLAEQQRIVGLLDEAFEGLATAKANAEKNLQNARALFESHLQSVFTQRGPGWVEKKLEDIADSDCSLSYGIVQPGEEFDEGMPIVRPTDLTTKVIRLGGLKRIDPKLAGGYKRTALQGGELLLCVRGSTGVVSIASPELAGANVTRGIVPIRFNRSLLLPEFGFYLISGGPVQSQIRGKTYGTALMQINIRDLRLISLSIPPLTEQKAIAAKLDSLHEKTQRLARLYERKHAALEALKKSLLHQAFTGAL